MSIIKQLWLAILVIMMLAFGGSFVVSTIASKNYLEQQLQMKNIDNANLLALSISQMEKDPVTIDLLLSAQFDTGHYQYIALLDASGHIIAQRKSDETSTAVPDWFIRLVPIEVQAGIAQIQDGWSQYGSIRLQSHTSFAYQQLWYATLMSLVWSLVIALLSGSVGALVLKAIFRPLKDVVNQAEAIGERRFVTIAEPATKEFKAVVAAMNRLSNRIRLTLQEDSLQLERLRLQTNHDRTTGLMNRAYFLGRVGTYAQDEESFAEGAMIVVRINNLAEIDNQLGRDATDSLLRKLGSTLDGLHQKNAALLCGRLTGTDFAVFSTVAADAYALASQIRNLLNTVLNPQGSLHEVKLSCVASKLVRMDHPETTVESMLQFISSMSPAAGDSPLLMEDSKPARQNSDEATWRQSLAAALNARRIKLAFYPVVDPDGNVIHQESPARLQLHADGAWLSAGEFMFWANRLDMMARIDDLVLERAIEALDQQGSLVIGLNVSTRAISSHDYIEKMIMLLERYPDCAARLWLELPEQGVFEDVQRFRDFCARLKPLGCKIGIEHVGAHIARISELHDIGLDYLKIDASIIRNIHHNIGNKALLRGLCLIAHSIGVIAIAEGVQTTDEMNSLPELGIDGMTGPAISSSNRYN